MKRFFSRHRIEEFIFIFLMKFSTALVLAVLIVLIGTVCVKGLGALSLTMVLKTPSGGYYLGREGGVLNAILGSVILAVSATAIAFAISLPVAISLNILMKTGSRFAETVRASLDILWGIPSIVYGAIGFVVMTAIGLPASLLGGILTVALVIFPIMVRAMDEVIRLTPRDLIDASYSLGAGKIDTAFRVVIRQTAPGIISAVLIAFGRGIGDAAAVLFTAGFTDAIPTSLLRPAATLPLAVFFQLGTPFPEVQDRAYASAFILTLIILVLSALTRYFAVRFRRMTIR